MKQTKRGILVLLTAVLLLASVPVYARAESLMDMATEISPMEFCSEDFGEYGHAPKTVYYTIILPKAGTITLNCSATLTCTRSDRFTLKLFDANGNLYKADELYSDYRTELSGLQAGTYYLSIYGDGDCYSFTNFYYTYRADKTPKVSFSIILKKGKTLQLGAIIENSKDKAKWTSSKKSVATVSATGLVKAVKAGTTYIKTYLPTGEYTTVKVIVK